MKSQGIPNAPNKFPWRNDVTKLASLRNFSTKHLCTFLRKTKKKYIYIYDTCAWTQTIFLKLLCWEDHWCGIAMGIIVWIRSSLFVTGTRFPGTCYGFSSAVTWGYLRATRGYLRLLLTAGFPGIRSHEATWGYQRLPEATWGYLWQREILESRPMRLPEATWGYLRLPLTTGFHGIQTYEATEAT